MTLAVFWKRRRTTPPVTQAGGARRRIYFGKKRKYAIERVKSRVKLASEIVTKRKALLAEVVKSAEIRARKSKSDISQLVEGYYLEKPIYVLPADVPTIDRAAERLESAEEFLTRVTDLVAEMLVIARLVLESKNDEEEKLAMMAILSF